MMKLRSLCIASAAFAILFASGPAFAGGPLDRNANDPDGIERWPNGGANIPWNPDGEPAGGPSALALGPINYTDAVAKVEAALQAWTDIPSATATYSNNGPMPFDVDVTNYAPFVNNLFTGANNSDGFSPVVFDVDGSIFVDLFGVSGVLGFASTDTRDAEGTPIEAVCFLNGGSINGGFPEADFDGVIVHEFGHYSGLGHTVVNGEVIRGVDTSGPSPNNTYGDSPDDEVETMYPFAIQGGGQVTPHADDIAYYSFAYPGPTYFATSGTIQGTIFAPNGTPITGVNVIARNVDDPFADAISAISGDRGTTGAYTINGLTPGASYTIHVDQILDGGFSTTPISLPGPEEFFNGANESNNVTSPDDPTDAVEIVAVAGTPFTGANVTFNTPGPGDDLNLGDDDSVEIFTPFPITICGQTFDSVFINSNGNVTFGAGSTDFSESVGDFLFGPPRIAGVWDDLNPSAGGTISFDQTNRTFTVSFSEVPEFISTGANSFDIVFYRERSFPQRKPRNNRFDIVYGDVSATDGAAGVSCGGAVAGGAEPQIDLSEARQPIQTRREPASYEIFAAGENDLANSTLRFARTTTFMDRFPGNNSPAEAAFVNLPFETSSTRKYTTLSPTGEDVDFFEFHAKADTTIVAEVTAGLIDSVIGLYRVTKTRVDDDDDDYDDDDDDDFFGFKVEAELIASDDDGGAGTLSRLVVPIEEGGLYAIAVSSFADLDFTGDGTTGGRYVVDIQSIDGTLIELGDDATTEVPLGFTFPFQGASYSSVFINSNGNISFGEGNTDFSETVAEFLGGPPRVAALYDDLSPNQGGLVIVNGDATSFSVTFQDVPEFFSTSGNTFTITLSASGAVSIEYGEIAATDGIAGVTEGGGAADPGATDLSAAAGLSVSGTTYEAFSFSNANDLDNVTLDFE